MIIGDLLVRAMPGDYGSVTAALVWGQKKYLTTNLYELFLQAGVLHLAVLSGQNITLVSEFMRSVCSSLSKKITSVFTIIVGIFYLSVLPHEAPIVRAVIMGSVASISIILNRPALPLYILIMSCLIMISFHPSWITDISFLLSVGATAGIIMLYPLFRVPRNGPVQHYLYSTLAITISAHIGILPVTALVFREYMPLSLLSNILLLWLIEPIMVLGIFFTLLEYSLPGGGILLIPPLQGLVSMFLFLVSCAATLSDVVVLRW